MNQILQVEKNKKNRKPIQIDIKKIILIFVIIIIIFGLILGGYWIYKNIINGNIIPPDSGQQQNTTNITLTKTEDNQLLIKVENPIGISGIFYNWNNEKMQTTQTEGKNIIEKIIDIPIGENTFYISVIDENQVETNKQEVFIKEETKPIIELSVVGNNLKMLVTSETELSKITYSWNSQNEKTEDMMTYQNRMEFEKTLEIPVGKNTLKIVAIDVNGKQTEKTQEIKGITKAKTTTEVKEEYWHFTVTGKENIKTVQFEFNGQTYLMNKETFGETKTVHYKVKLIEGKNYLKIVSTTESDGVDTTSWEHEYTAR